MKKLLAFLAVASILGGCVVAPPPPPPHHVHDNDRDRDRDGVPNRYDHDRDNDRVPNAYDRRPNDPYRR